MSERKVKPLRTDLNLAWRLVIKRRIPTSLFYLPYFTYFFSLQPQIKKLPLTAPLLLLDNTTAISGSDPTIE